jgi:hypothetical protein
VATALTLLNPNPIFAGIIFAATGTFTGAAPTNVDYTYDGGTTWTTSPSQWFTTQGNRWFALPTCPQNGTYAMQVRATDTPAVTSTPSPNFTVGPQSGVADSFTLSSQTFAGDTVTDGQTIATITANFPTAVTGTVTFTITTNPPYSQPTSWLDIGAGVDTAPGHSGQPFPATGTNSGNSSSVPLKIATGMASYVRANFPGVLQIPVTIKVQQAGFPAYVENKSIKVYQSGSPAAGSSPQASNLVIPTGLPQGTIITRLTATYSSIPFGYTTLWFLYQNANGTLDIDSYGRVYLRKPLPAGTYTLSGEFTQIGGTSGPVTGFTPVAFSFTLTVRARSGTCTITSSGVTLYNSSRTGAGTAVATATSSLGGTKTYYRAPDFFNTLPPYTINSSTGAITLSRIPNSMPDVPQTDNIAVWVDNGTNVAVGSYNSTVQWDTSGGTYDIGRGQTYAKFADFLTALNNTGGVNDGCIAKIHADTDPNYYLDDLPGGYTDNTIFKTVWFQGVGQPILPHTIGNTDAGIGKGWFSQAAGDIALSGLTIGPNHKGDPGGNVSAIKSESPNIVGGPDPVWASNVYIKDCTLTSCDSGIVGPFWSARVRAINVESIGCGSGDGQSHGWYSDDTDVAEITNCKFRNTNVGHNFKSRGKFGIITNCLFYDGNTGTTSYVLDLPIGGLQFVRGSIVHRGPNWSNYPIFRFGEENYQCFNWNLLHVQGCQILCDAPSSLTVSPVGIWNDAAQNQNGRNLVRSEANQFYGFFNSSLWFSGANIISIGDSTLSTRPSAIDLTNPTTGVETPLKPFLNPGDSEKVNIPSGNDVEWIYLQDSSGKIIENNLTIPTSAPIGTVLGTLKVRGTPEYLAQRQPNKTYPGQSRVYANFIVWTQATSSPLTTGASANMPPWTVANLFADSSSGTGGNGQGTGYIVGEVITLPNGNKVVADTLGPTGGVLTAHFSVAGSPVDGFTGAISSNHSGTGYGAYISIKDGSCLWNASGYFRSAPQFSLTSASNWLSVNQSTGVVTKAANIAGDVQQVTVSASQTAFQTLTKTLMLSQISSLAISVANPPAFSVPVGGGTVNVIASIPSTSSQAISFTANTADGTAKAGTDYSAIVNQTYTIPAGQTQVVIPIAVFPNVPGSNLNFTLNLSNPVNAGLGTSTATITIQTPAAPQLSVADVTATGGQQATFIVRLPGPAASAVTFNYATSDGSGVAGTNYVSRAGTRTIAAGQSNTTIGVSTINVPGAPDATFHFTISNVTNGIAPVAPATATIVNGTAPDLTFSNAVVDITTSTATSIVFNGVLDQQIGNATSTVSYATQDGTAVAGVDYVPASGILTLPSGATSIQLTVNLTRLTVGSKQFFVVFSNPVGINLVNSQVSGTINGPLTYAPPTGAVVNLPPDLPTTSPVMTYSSLISDIQKYLERGTNTLAPVLWSQLPRLISLAELRIIQGLKIQGFKEIVLGALSINQPVVMKPARWRSTSSFAILDPVEGTIHLEQRDLSYCRALAPNPTIVPPQRPIYYAEMDSQHWWLAPNPDLEYPFESINWCIPEPLSAQVQTNWATVSIPNLLLYSTLLECMPFVKDDTRIPLWQNMYMMILTSLTSEDVGKIVDQTTSKRQA